MWKIKKCNFIPMAIILFFVLLCYTYVYADDGSLGRTPDGVFPIQENDVIMESEEITIDLEKNTVECIFVFHNTGKSKEVFMGFPGKLDESRGGEFSEAVDLELGNFKTFVEGKELPVTCEKGIENHTDETLEALRYSEWFTFTVPFQADEKVTVHNTYNFRPSYDSMGYIYTGYVLQTGALWKGSIGSAKVTFKLGKIQPYQIEELGPGGFIFVGDDLVWERNDFEPRYDLNLLYNKWRYSEDSLNNLDGKSKDEIIMEIESYKKVNELVDKGDTEGLLDMYNKAVKEKDSILSLYIKSFIPKDKISEEISTLGTISVEYKNYDYLISCDVEGPETELIQLRISHIGYGIEILDAQVESSACFVNLSPGIEYNITCTLNDWMDRTQQKTKIYKVPEQAEVSEVSTENQTQPSVSAAASASSVLNLEPEIVNESTDGSVNEPVSESINAAVNEPESEAVNKTVNELVENGKNNGSKFFIWVLSGAIVLGFTTVLLVIKRRKNGTR